MSPPRPAFRSGCFSITSSRATVSSVRRFVQRTRAGCRIGPLSPRTVTIRGNDSGRCSVGQSPIRCGALCGWKLVQRRPVTQKYGPMSSARNEPGQRRFSRWSRTVSVQEIFILISRRTTPLQRSSTSSTVSCLRLRRRPVARTATRLSRSKTQHAAFSIRLCGQTSTDANRGATLECARDVG